MLKENETINKNLHICVCVENLRPEKMAQKRCNEHPILQDQASISVQKNYKMVDSRTGAERVEVEILGYRVRQESRTMFKN